MKERTLSSTTLQAFQQYLIREEKSTATQEKYLRDVRVFWAYAGGQRITKELVVRYKQYLQKNGYAVRSINSMLASLNSLLGFLGWQDCRVKSIRQQKPTYCAEDQELTRPEYLRLLAAAKQKPQLRLVMETICGTGIRVSELRFFTVEAVRPYLLRHRKRPCQAGRCAGPQQHRHHAHLYHDHRRRAPQKDRAAGPGCIK